MCNTVILFFAIFDYTQQTLPNLFLILVWPPLLPAYISVATQARISMRHDPQSLKGRAFTLSLHACLYALSYALFILYYRGTGETAILPLLLMFFPTSILWWLCLLPLKIYQGGRLSVLEIFLIPAVALGSVMLLNITSVFPAFSAFVSHCPGGIYNRGP